MGRKRHLFYLSIFLFLLNAVEVVNHHLHYDLSNLLTCAVRHMSASRLNTKKNLKPTTKRDYSHI